MHKAELEVFSFDKPNAWHGVAVGRLVNIWVTKSVPSQVMINFARSIFPLANHGPIMAFACANCDSKQA